MPSTQTSYLFNQIVKFIDRKYFEFLVNRYAGNRYVKHFTCWNQLMVLVWAQLTTRRSLRDIVGSLAAHKEKLYRLGMGVNIARSTLSEANTKRDVVIFRELALRMMEKALKIRIIDKDLEAIAAAFSLSGFFAVDSSTIQLTSTLFSWSTPKQGYGGIKMHTLFDLLRLVPALVLVTDHDAGDQVFMEDYPYQPECVYIFDKAYVKPKALAFINSEGAFFIVRRKTDLDIGVVSDHSIVGEAGVLADQTVIFRGSKSKKGYPHPLRMVTYYSTDKEQEFVFLTNSFTLPASTVAALYLRRWDIERFFKWIKQHLYIQDFYGRSVNAVCIQIYVAVITYCTIALIADEYESTLSRYELLRALGTALFEKRHLPDVIDEITKKEPMECPDNFYGMESLFGKSDILSSRDYYS